MVKVSTWITFGIFVLLLSSVLIYQRVNKDKADEIAIAEVGELGTLEPVESLFQIRPDAYVSGLRVEGSDDSAVEVQRSQEDSEWLLVEPADDADQEAINRVINQVQSLVIEDTLGREIDLEALGLEKPTYKIQLQISNGGIYILYIGDVTITNTSYYARKPSDSPVIVNKYSLDSVLNWLSDPPIQDQPTSAPES